jgi:D-alanyl-D-alanine carboxypeptidase
VAGKPLDFTPGTKWAYSNTNYILLGRVIEVVSHETYHHYVQAHLLDPLGLKQTFTLADERRVPDMALGYRRADGKLSLAPPLDEGFGWAAGDLISTLTDLEKWSEALAGGKVVTPADYVLMTTEVPIKDGTSGYGFAQFLDSVDDQPRIGHTGGALGFTSADEYFPRQDTRIIVFTDLTDDPEPGERFNTGVFEALFPGIAAAADRPAAGEDAAVTAKARALFIALQQGTADSSMLGARLAAKMQAGLGQRLAGEFAPYGAPTAVIFKGHRTDGGLSWSDYVLKFGPGSSFKFSIALDDSGKIISMGFG